MRGAKIKICSKCFETECRCKNRKYIIALNLDALRYQKPHEAGSPCAGGCRHRWCDGYRLGYEHGQIDVLEK